MPEPTPPDSKYERLIAAAREKPKTISVGSTSPGGGAHSMMHRLEKLSGARFNIVSFKSGAETVTAVAKRQAAADVVTVYWHFMDVLWIYLFVLLFYWR